MRAVLTANGSDAVLHRFASKWAGGSGLAGPARLRKEIWFGFMNSLFQ
jgi:hypothetical protein